MNTGNRWLFLAVLVVLTGVGLALHSLQQESLWFDEAWTAWAIYYDPTAVSGQRDNINTAREITAFLRDDTLSALANIARDDVHPPFYYLLLNTWSLVMGESEFALRVVSVLWGALAIAGVIAWGRRFHWRAGIIAGVVLATSGFFLVYTREARMYTQFLALAVWCVVLCKHYRRQPTLRHGLLYGVVIAMLLLTHYVGAIIVFTQALLTLPISNPRRLPHWLAPLILAMSISSIWAPFALRQVTERGAPASLPLLSDGATLLALGYQLTTNSMIAALILLIVGLVAATRRVRWVWVLAWGVLPVIFLLFINVRTPIFQLRYVIVLWAAFAVLLGASIDAIARRTPRRVGWVLTLLLTGGWAWHQLQDAEYLPKSDWRSGVQNASDARDTQEPALVSYLDSSPVAYYDRQFNLRRGINLDIGWQADPPDLAAHVRSLEQNERIWLIAQASEPRTWEAIYQLQAKATRAVSYGQTVNGQLFYRFTEQSPARELHLFWRLDGQDVRQPYTYTIHNVISDERVCATSPDAAALRYQLSIIQGYHTVVAQTEATPEMIGESTTGVCMTLPDLPAGSYTLRLRLLNTAGTPALLLENPDDPQYWGDFMGVATLHLR